MLVHALLVPAFQIPNSKFLILSARLRHHVQQGRLAALHAIERAPEGRREIQRAFDRPLAVHPVGLRHLRVVEGGLAQRRADARSGGAAAARARPSVLLSSHSSAQRRAPLIGLESPPTAAVAIACCRASRCASANFAPRACAARARSGVISRFTSSMSSGSVASESAAMS